MFLSSKDRKPQRAGSRARGQREESPYLGGRGQGVLLDLYLLGEKSMTLEDKMRRPTLASVCSGFLCEQRRELQ